MTSYTRSIAESVSATEALNAGYLNRLKPSFKAILSEGTGKIKYIKGHDKIIYSE